MQGSSFVVVLAGCGAGGPGLLADSAMFTSGQWETGPMLDGPRGGHSVTVLPDGQVAVLGGASPDSPVSAQICDVAANACRASGGLLGTFERHDAMRLATGRILVVGGTFDAAPEVYDPATGATREVRSATVRAGAKGVLLADGRAFALGPGTPTAVFDPATETWQGGPSLAVGRGSHAAVTLADGRVLVAGGCARCATSSVEIFDPATGSWSIAAPTLTTHDDHTMTVLADGRVLVIGGAPGSASIGAELYDPATDTWTAAGDGHENRLGHAATLLPDGRVLVTGGVIRQVDQDALHPTSAVFDPASATWTTGDDLSWRQYHAAALLPDGRALVLGGDRGYMEARTGD
jgi:hypothetical protein